jgi:tetratricopeptide (TPR) repeat protein/transcriptional regulator with XRE-family HTH domain
VKKIEKDIIPNHLLKEQRIQHYWTQSQVAEKVGTTTVNVSRWESGSTIPGLYFRQKLCELFGKSADELGLISETERQEPATAAASALPTLWNVPFRRNPFFTGREEVLSRLHTVLTTGNVAAVTQTQAITGLGGIGKTQTAVEYAYRHQSRYRAVLWVKADSREILTSDFVTLAGLLNLPEKDEQDQIRVVATVKNWLKDHSDWLLILDNVEDPEMASDFLPPSSRGHILLTTRAQTTGTVAQRVEIEKMEPEEGALFLLRRAKRLALDASLGQAPASDRTKAFELSQIMDGLPLALDQAAAYIEETDCGLSGYLSRYQTRHTKLLNLRGESIVEHPESVVTTWSLSFEKVQEASPAAADLLRLCAFFHPDAIPEEVIAEGAPELGPNLEPVADLLKLDAAVRELRKFSLLRRDPEAQVLTIHRLVQQVIKDTMDDSTQRQWGERAVRAVNRALPEHVVFSTWQRCERCLPHSQVCAALIEQWHLDFAEAARLLDRTAHYLHERAQYGQAELFFQRALRIREQLLGPEHLDLAFSINNLAGMYYFQGRYAEAEPLYLRALKLQEQNRGLEHHAAAQTLNNLGLLYKLQGKYEQAEPLFLRSLALRERLLGPEHQDVAIALNNLAGLYREQSRYAEAEPLFQRALKIREQSRGTNHPDIAIAMGNLATLYSAQGKYTQAESLFQQATTIFEQVLGSKHPNVAITHKNRAKLYYKQKKYTQAEKYYKRALAIYEETLGHDHPKVAESLNNLAEVYIAQRKYTRAEQLLTEALEVYKRVLKEDHPDMATTLSNLADLYRIQGKYTRAVSFYQQALNIREKILKLEDPVIATTLLNYAVVLRKMNRDTEAMELEARAKAI